MHAVNRVGSLDRHMLVYEDWRVRKTTGPGHSVHQDLRASTGPEVQHTLSSGWPEVLRLALGMGTTIPLRTARLRSRLSMV